MHDVALSKHHVKTRKSARILISARVQDFSPKTVQADFQLQAVFSAFSKYQVCAMLTAWCLCYTLVLFSAEPWDHLSFFVGGPAIFSFQHPPGEDWSEGSQQYGWRKGSCKEECIPKLLYLPPEFVSMMAYPTNFGAFAGERTFCRGNRGAICHVFWWGNPRHGCYWIDWDRGGGTQPHSKQSWMVHGSWLWKVVAGVGILEHRREGMVLALLPPNARGMMWYHFTS